MHTGQFEAFANANAPEARSSGGSSCHFHPPITQAISPGTIHRPERMKSMEVLSSVVLWRNEPFSEIRSMVDSSLRIAKVSAELGVDVAHRSILCAIQPNETQPNVQEWASAFSLSCAKLGKTNTSSLDRPRAEFELVSVDPSEALSNNLDHILAFALSYMFMGGSAILHDIPFDDQLAAWSLKTFLPIDWRECCLVSVRSSRPKRVRLAYIPAINAYVRGGLFQFRREQYFRKHGLFSKPTYGINNLDDLVSAMEEVAAYHGWKVKQLQLPHSAITRR